MIVYGAEPRSCFSLMGKGENAATLAMAWCMERSEELRQQLVKALGRADWPTDPWAVTCQTQADDKGYTDIEIRSGAFHLLIEAKAGMVLPSEKQLRRYVARLDQRRGNPLLVTISAASREWAQAQGSTNVDGVPVVHLSWSDVRQAARLAESATRSPIEKLWLNELIQHLEGYGMTQNRFDARAYIVSLSGVPIGPSDPLTWIDVVVKQGYYFHPFAKGWLSVPPAYLGFRYKAAFRSVHFVEKAEIVDQLNSVDERWPVVQVPHVVYKLGPAMNPKEPLPLGKIYNRGRNFVALDLLLSGQCQSYAEAIAKTREREKDEA